MTTRKLSQTDKRLLASAWAELARAPRVYTGRSDSKRTAVSTAKYRGQCARCGAAINIGDDIRHHDDFPGAVHDGCRRPAVAPRVRRSRPARVSRDPVVCPLCHTQHAGECL